VQTQQVPHSRLVALPVEGAQTIVRVGDQHGLAERRPYPIERQALTRDRASRPPERPKEQTCGPWRSIIHHNRRPAQATSSSSYIPEAQRFCLVVFGP